MYGPNYPDLRNGKTAFTASFSQIYPVLQFSQGFFSAPIHSNMSITTEKNSEIDPVLNLNGLISEQVEILTEFLQTNKSTRVPLAFAFVGDTIRVHVPGSPEEGELVKEALNVISSFQKAGDSPEENQVIRGKKENKSMEQTAAYAKSEKKKTEYSAEGNEAASA
jgi:hypothetical protein